jgi:triosephosphate isomerase
MHMTAGAARDCARDIVRLLPVPADREIALAPPFTALPAVGEALRGSDVRLAAQDLFWEEEGPYTGEVSGPMLADAGVTYVIVGHSERRLYLGETDRMVGRKALAALRAGLHPIVCVGEDEEARDAGRAAQVVRDMLLRSLEEVPREMADRLLLSYEPVWAIGTGRSASPADVSEMHALLRVELRMLFPGRAAEGVRILYGGSVTQNNADALMAADEVDGVLVGGASMRPAEFARVVAGAP